jgi:hypothetical protein
MVILLPWCDFSVSPLWHGDVVTFPRLMWLTVLVSKIHHGMNLFWCWQAMNGCSMRVVPQHGNIWEWIKPTAIKMLNLPGSGAQNVESDLVGALLCVGNPFDQPRCAEPLKHRCFTKTRERLMSVSGWCFAEIKIRRIKMEYTLW